MGWDYLCREEGTVRRVKSDQCKSLHRESGESFTEARERRLPPSLKTPALGISARKPLIALLFMSKLLIPKRAKLSFWHMSAAFGTGHPLLPRNEVFFGTPFWAFPEGLVESCVPSRSLFPVLSDQYVGHNFTLPTDHRLNYGLHTSVLTTG